MIPENKFFSSSLSVTRTFSWSTSRSTHSLRIEISPADFAAAHALIDAPAEVKLREAARFFRDHQWPDYFARLVAETAEPLQEVIVAFWQNLPYHHAGLWPRLPAETLASGWANCGDRSIGAVSLLNACGLSQAVYIEVWHPYHALLGFSSQNLDGDAIFCDGKRYILWELTAKGSRPGHNFFQQVSGARIVLPLSEEE